MGKKKQLFLDDQFEIKNEFGGALLKKSHAKYARPIALKKTMHLTLRSSKAKGKWSFRSDKNRMQKIDTAIKKQAKKFGVEIFKYANVGNHLHLLVKATYRKGFISFLKAISGLIVRIVLGAERGNAKLNESERGFWDQRPWTRVLFTWTEFKIVKRYVEQNFNEAMGFIPFKPRKYRSTA